MVKTKPGSRYGTSNSTSHKSLFKTWETWGDSDDRHYEHWREWIIVPVVVVIILTIVALITSLVIGIRQWDHHQAARSCIQKEQKTGLDTEFIDISFWNYDCYVILTTGEKIPYGKVRVDLNN